MRNPEVNRRLQQLEQLINRTSDATQDINLQGHWGRYLCIMAAGFLEYSLQAIYSDFAYGASNPYVASFVEKQLQKSISNPKSEIFLQTAGAFNPQWREELEEFFETDQVRLKGAIDSIMSARNSIAHGGPQGISVASVRNYLECSVKVLEFIEGQCYGSNPKSISP